jgi:hypothetical protein
MLLGEGRCQSRDREPAGDEDGGAERGGPHSGEDNPSRRILRRPKARERSGKRKRCRTEGEGLPRCGRGWDARGRRVRVAKAGSKSLSG